MDTICTQHGLAQGTAPSWGGRSLTAKVKMLLPSSQHCTYEPQLFPGDKDTEATLIISNTSAHRETLTLSHTDEAGARHSHHMATRLTASMC